MSVVTASSILGSRTTCDMEVFKQSGILNDLIQKWPLWKCIEDVPIKTIRIYPNQKPWINSEVRAALDARTNAFNRKHAEKQKQASYALHKTITAAKHQHKDKVEAQLNTSNARSMWQGISNITDFREKKNSTMSTERYREKQGNLPERLAPRCSDPHCQRLIRDYICSVLPASLDPLQFAYRSNRSTDDAIAHTLHTAISHLDKRNTHQVVKMGNKISSPLILNTGAPQGCVLSPLLYSLYTHDCVATHSSNVIIKFADDMTVVGLTTNNDESAYREEVLAPKNFTRWYTRVQ
ncbi:hypothetical protein SKAU_G00327200 [Synaphobranchus kaupii]|uniref:Reverse transcriptase domain-containing protein n=1 Tax=Synaphobranchus kaupii TaxID=118154 RepID=A0A9Q1EPV7_SYNKA|nr:hypothetical protein SKAU_G00327200 [Synaphobranchus kaupii]